MQEIGEHRDLCVDMQIIFRDPAEHSRSRLPGPDRGGCALQTGPMKDTTR
jgi:hypothetical protein